MKKLFKILIAAIMTSFVLVSCSNVLDVNSERVTLDKNYRMSSPNDTIYAMYGIFHQLQKIADSYVLLGELRADLLDVTENSNLNLREINNLDISKNNPYANIRDYYSVVNNCNYVIQNLDTAYITRAQHVMKGYVAAVKSIRAWTYMQMALNFGTVKYYDKPILTEADAESVNNYPDISINELADLLIADLTPWKNIDLPSSLPGGIFPIQFVLGDLYLWKGEGYYDKAATEYHDLMYKGYWGIYMQYQSSWNLNPNKLISVSSGFTTSWISTFTPNYGETITQILCPTTYGQKFDLDSLNFNYQLTPSAVAVINWDTQIYYNTALDYMAGDLRKYGSIVEKNSIGIISNGVIPTYPTNTITVSNNPKFIIWKYLAYDQNVMVYRSSLLYLRYAEAVNRLRKPNLAFAVLKNGLRNATMSSPAIVPLKEKTTESYMDFSDRRFDYNAGIRWRGLGPRLKDPTGRVISLNDCDSTFVIKEQSTLNDSILYVEDLIQKELALETAFEGNRFQDLMRFAIRRNDPAYLADKVAAKHPDNLAVIREKLMHPENWYLKK
jgi:hypothetical protein